MVVYFHFVVVMSYHMHHVDSCHTLHPKNAMIQGELL
jgi:hypothetical protein